MSGDETTTDVPSAQALILELKLHRVRIDQLETDVSAAKERRAAAMSTLREVYGFTLDELAPVAGLSKTGVKRALEAVGVDTARRPKVARS